MSSQITKKYATLSDDLINHVYEYLDYPTDILNSALVCKDWEKSPKLRKKRAKIGNPTWIVNLLKDNGLSFRNLPHFQLPVLRDGQDYIDYLYSDNETAPIFRFKDKLHRIGIGLNLRGKYSVQTGNRNDQQTIQNTHAILPIYDHFGTWCCGYACARPLFDLTHRHHYLYHPSERCLGKNCPVDVNSLTDTDKIGQFVDRLLKGKDPLFRLEGYAAPKGKTAHQRTYLIAALAVAILAYTCYQYSQILSNTEYTEIS